MKHTLTIPDFVPTTLNVLMRGRLRVRMQKARADRELIGYYALWSGIPKATGKRRVSLHVTAQKGRLPDPDGLLKGALDSLVACGLLLDDDAARCELGAVTVVRGAKRETVFILEDKES